MTISEVGILVVVGLGFQIVTFLLLFSVNCDLGILKLKFEGLEERSKRQ